MMIDARLAILSCLAATLPAGAANATPPTQLYGKSVVVSYVNTTSLRTAGTQSPFHTTSTPRRLHVYVSSAGRAFMRAGETSRRGLEQLGASSTNASGGATTLQFQGRSLIVGFGYINGATRVQIDFDPDFRSCSATIEHGKAGGSDSYNFKSGGKTYEIRSSTAGSISCAIMVGNILTN